MIVKNTPILINVVGPTAIGKTNLAIGLAKHFNCDILSADSRQFFKEMTIGTAVPSKEQLSLVPHHFIQHIHIQDHYSVGDFEREGIACIQKLTKENDKVILVGGSGLYINAINKGLDHFPKINPSVRKKLILQLSKQGISTLQEQLRILDPISFHKIDKNNPQRLIRALEVCIGTERPYSSYLHKKKCARNFRSIYIGLTAPRTFLYQKINQRVDHMIKNGWIEEVKSLYPYSALNALKTVGYKELFAYLDKVYSLNEAVEEIKKNTRRFAKRQITWFRKNEDIHWFNNQTPTENIIRFVEDKILQNHY